MSWLRRGARVSSQTTPAHLVITKGAVTLEGVSAKFWKMRYLGGGPRKNARGPKHHRTSSKCRRAWTPLLFFNFFPSSTSEWVEHAGGTCSSLDRKRDMSYTEPLWEINGNQAPVSPRASLNPVYGVDLINFIKKKNRKGGKANVFSSGMFSINLFIIKL